MTDTKSVAVCDHVKALPELHVTKPITITTIITKHERHNTCAATPKSNQLNH